MMKRIILYGIVLAFTIQVNAKTSFRTERLKTIAGMVKLNVPDSFEKHLTIDSLGRYKNKPVKLKTNSFGDVSHIGYKLFNGRTDGTHDPMMPFFDFIERYFLELDLELDGKKPAERIFLDKVECIRGNIAMRHKVTDRTGFSIKHVGRRAYTIQWVLDKDTLELFVPADCQLILGANAVELETIFERDLKRVVPSAFDCDWAEEDVSLSDDGLSVANPGSYLSDEIKSDLYLQKKEGKWALITDAEHPIESIKNILLTGCFTRDIAMALTIDRYGYRKTSLSITLQQFVEYCRLDGCVLYVGIKTHTADNVTATIFALNNELGYNHVLAVNFPTGILSGRQNSITGTSYVYIPLQNVTEDFFMQKMKEK